MVYVEELYMHCEDTVEYAKHHMGVYALLSSLCLNKQQRCYRKRFGSVDAMPANAYHAANG